VPIRVNYSEPADRHDIARADCQRAPHRKSTRDVMFTASVLLVARDGLG
jgi:hypothetical protein